MIWVLISTGELRDGSRIVLSPAAANLMDVADGQPVVVRAGALSCPAEVVIQPLLRDQVGLTPELAAKLHLPLETRYRLKKTNETIVIGPVLGILNPLLSPEKVSHPNMVRFMMSLQETAGVAVLFTPGSVDFAQKTVYGRYYHFTLNGEGEWRNGVLPMPDAVYDISYPTSARFQDRLRECGVQVFNRTTRFNKWKIHQLLREEPGFGTHLPETDLLRDYQSLSQALLRYKSLYLKPVSGSRGMGVIKIDQFGKDQFKCSFRQRGRNKAVIISDLLEIPACLGMIMGTRRYIAQRSLELATIWGRTFDLRIMVQRDLDGRWRVSGAIARVSAEGSIVNNLSNGGEAVSFKRALRLAYPDLSGDRLKDLRESIEALSLRVASYLDSRLGPLGEIGLDIGLDQEAGIWIIEVNGRPNKRLVLENVLTRLYKQPLYYAAYLAGFGAKTSRRQNSEKYIR